MRRLRGGAAAQVIERDLGWKRIRREIHAAGKAGVKIGLLAGDAEREGGEPYDNVDVAIANEFGTDTIPERSFLRSTADAQREQIAAFKAREWDRILRGQSTVREALGRLGAWHRGEVQRTITRLREPPNAPSTIRAKGSDNPLIDTGQMRQAVNYEVEG